MPDSDNTPAHPSLMRQLAHELRDALSPLASSADLARLRNFDAETSRLLAQKVERGLRRSLAILDTFVLAEQAEHATLALQLEAVPLEEIVERARQAVGSGARFSFMTQDGAATVRADVAHSAQVLIAVLQHASLITVADRPVEVEMVASGPRPCIRIRGRIAAENAPGEEWFASYRGGDGRMALRTALQIMKLQGGVLELVKGTPGTLELVLQFAPGAESRERSQSAAPSSAPGVCRPGRGARADRVLIVDDSPEVRRAYAEALRELGYDVAEAADAEQALGTLQSSKPDVALIDIHLPRMNGYRLAQAIRARAGAGIYLVMLSGMALDSVTRELAQEAGFDDSLDKMAGPIALRELLEAGRARRGEQ